MPIDPSGDELLRENCDIHTQQETNHGLYPGEWGNTGCVDAQVLGPGHDRGEHEGTRVNEGAEKRQVRTHGGRARGNIGTDAPERQRPIIRIRQTR